MANRLAFYDLPTHRSPAPDPAYLTCEIYPFGPDAPESARVLSPATLGEWLESTTAPRLLVSLIDARGIRFREMSNHRTLVIQLASQLYRRDHGANPPTPEVLVGPYLEQLPREFPDEGQGDSTPTHEAPDD
jgi:hypothetical protein